MKVLLLKVMQGTRAEEGTEEAPWSLGTKEQESGGKQRGVRGAGVRDDRAEEQWEGEEAGGCNCKGCCHFQMLILISRMQSLVKILSDLCQILLQIKT